MAETVKKLSLGFHGRVIDHLGIQMYQSPTAALAELVSNCWDADAEKVEITLPAAMSKDAEIVVKDNGNGMTFEDCQKRFLNVGYDCRGGKAKAVSGEKNRPVLGRKGIGKFAGFGIAESIRIDTVAKGTGERTVFELDLGKLRGTDYIEGSTDIEVKEYSGPSAEMKALHGTSITLKSLVLKKTQNAEQFSRSMSRRFLLVQRVGDFRVLVNGEPIPADADCEHVEFEFPRDYTDGEKPTGLTIDENGWGVEDLGQGRLIRWRFVFYEDTIKEDELRGVSIFANGKLAQRPFAFNIIGGISGQQGLEYLSGKVEADYIDSLNTDLIATERQRINWEHEEAIPLLEWGRKRVDDLCKVWKRRRAADKLKAMEDKMAPFAGRLSTLQPSERKTVRSALSKLAQVSSLTTKQFEDLGEAVLTSWEAGRLKELVHNLADSTDMTADRLIDLLMEANVLTALNAYEAIKTKLSIIEELRRLVEKQELENAVRDYIAKNPWLVSPQWETFKKEISLKKLIAEIAASKGIEPEKQWSRRVDLLLASGETVLVLEFMQPDKKVDLDHISRFEYYVTTIRTHFQANTGQPFRNCVGYLVASKLDQDAAILQMIDTKKTNNLFYLDWETLLVQAERQYEEFIEILRERAPEDARLKELQLA
ncbi:MAG: ATP-binding protein [Chloroflexi bacterium]|nr:ATP-binding protein [Chloroflexota bacterium]